MFSFAISSIGSFVGVGRSGVNTFAFERNSVVNAAGHESLGCICIHSVVSLYFLYFGGKTYLPLFFFEQFKISAIISLARVRLIRFVV